MVMTFEEDFPSLKGKIFTLPTNIKIGMFVENNTDSTTTDIRTFECKISDTVFYAVPMSYVKNNCLDKQKVRDAIEKILNRSENKFADIMIKDGLYKELNL